MILLSFFDFFHIYSRFLDVLGLLGTYWGPLGVLALVLGPPRAPMSSTPSIATIIRGLVQPSVQLGKFADFFNLPK